MTNAPSSFHRKHVCNNIMVRLLLLLATLPVVAYGSDDSDSNPASTRASTYLNDVTSNANSLTADSIRAYLNIENPIWADEDDYDAAVNDFEGLVDCADFNVPAFVRLLYASEDAYDEDLRYTIKSALLGWRFWPDKDGGGGIGSMHIWTENHQINFHIAEYLVGSLYPTEIFTRSGKFGSVHAKLGKARTLSWLNHRYRWGFSEWRSDVYSKFVVDATATLALLAPDKNVAGKASVVLDLLLLDSALHTFRGKPASSRGRSYGLGDFAGGSGSSTEVLNWLIGGNGYSDGAGGISSVASVALLATQPNRVSGLKQYDISEVIQGIASEVDSKQELVARETIGIGPENKRWARRAGLGYNDPADAFTWMGLGCYTHPLVVPLIVKAGNTFGLFGSSGDYESVFDAWSYFQDVDPKEMRSILEAKVPITYYGTLGPAETMYWRTPYVALASVTDFRKGALGDQQRVWQATLANGAAVFTTYPGPGNVAEPGVLAGLLSGSSNANNNNGDDDNDDGDGNEDGDGGDEGSDYSAGYWTGSASLPRIGQYKNVALILYRPPPDLYDSIKSTLFPYKYTHAAFPIDYLDEYYDDLENTGRIVGRYGDGYVALFSGSIGGGWKDDYEIYAPTGQYGTAVWACVVGDVNTHDSFADFTTAMEGATFDYVDDSNMVTTLSFSDGDTYTFGWDSQLVKTNNRGKREKVKLDNYGRFDNPYVTAKFPSTGKITIKHEDRVHVLNFQSGSRNTRNAGLGGTIALVLSVIVAVIALGVAFVHKKRGGNFDFVTKFCSPRTPELKEDLIAPEESNVMT